jgi:adenylyltransferase/sulfurtransferase
MTPLDRERYSRQILFAGLGEAGQEGLLRSCAAIAGCGALGSFHAATLARAGVGRLLLIDRDYVELSNLQRQWLYDEADAREALPKAVAAARKLTAVNSSVTIEHFVADITPDNIDDLLGPAQVILDGTDNFETRYLINDFAISGHVPWIYGGAIGSYGITMPVLPGETCCLRCVYPQPPSGVQPTCETAGILAGAAATIAALQSMEALKILAGKPEAVSRQITTIDVWSGCVRLADQPARDPECPACGRRDFEYLRGGKRAPVSLCGRNAVQIHERARPVDLKDLQRRLSSLGDVRANEFALRFFLPPYEITIFPDGRAIVKGTTDTGLARSLYSRYVG